MVLATLVILAILALYFYKIESDYVSNFLVASGTVGAINYKYRGATGTSDNRIRTTQVSFKVGAKRYSVDSRGLQVPRFSGSVEVYYDPTDPSTARIKRIDEVYFFTLIMLFFLLIGGLFSILTYFISPFIREL